MGAIMQGISHEAQDTSIVARCAAYMMASPSRHADVVYVSDGKYIEIEKSILWPTFVEKIKGDGPSDDEVLERIFALAG